ncbi:MAG: radical SAM protein [Nitrospirae bacterium]|nr:radical SAM protein [Nitrospirota bacterium]
MRVRLENFGGIVAFEKPALLVLADRALMRKMGHEGGARWSGETSVGLLSGPVEVHLSITDFCSNGCRHCYSNSTPAPSFRPPLDVLKQRVDDLHRLGALHVALGGGEPFTFDGLFDLAAYIREKGMIPNVTTSGRSMTEEQARQSRIFGQVNVSLDGVGEAYAVHRGYRGFEAADRALRLLRRRVKRVGINCVVSRKNFEVLEEVVRYAKSLKLNEVEFLRYKPTGRAAGRKPAALATSRSGQGWPDDAASAAASSYESTRLTEAQGRSFFPLLFEWTRRHRIRLKSDCSFVPFLCYHDPGVERLEHFTVQGCVAGNYLMAVHADGSASGCSFWTGAEAPLAELPNTWEDPGRFAVFRNWNQDAPEPCQSCAYLHLCRGGCRAVAAFATGDARQPDPECPKVIDYHRERISGDAVGH